MPPLPPQVKTAEEIEANIKHLVGLQREELLEQPPQKPQPEGEMSAFKKFVSSNLHLSGPENFQKTWPKKLVKKCVKLVNLISLVFRPGVF